MNTINQTTETIPIDDIQPHPRNPRRGNATAIHDSITTNGFYGTIVAQRSTGHILVGNHRYAVAKAAGATHIPVTWVDVDDDHALRILLVDNRTNDIAGYDDDELMTMLTSILDEFGTLDGTGYDDDIFTSLTNDDGDDELDLNPTGENTDTDHVPFRFGDYNGRVRTTTYRAFVTEYTRHQTDTGEPMLDDVLTAWLRLA
jgi:hypothetical protein